MVTAFPDAKVFTGDQPVWLTDSVGNGYVVRNPVRLRAARQQQESIAGNGRKTTTGAFASAWIDHGPAPRDASYEYAVLVKDALVTVE